MTIEDEIQFFVEESAFLESIIKDLSKTEVGEATSQDFFIAEAVAFRMFRIFERFLRAVFLDSCTRETTLNDNRIVSKLRCADWETAEDILKAGNRFLDWGNIENTKRSADLIFENGFPISDLLAPVHSNLIDLQRIRNFIAHDSAEATRGFEKVFGNYLSAGTNPPTSAGELLISRKRASEGQVVRKIWRKIVVLEAIYRGL